MLLLLLLLLYCLFYFEAEVGTISRITKLIPFIIFKPKNYPTKHKVFFCAQKFYRTKDKVVFVPKFHRTKDKAVLLRCNSKSLLGFWRKIFVSHKTAALIFQFQRYNQNLIVSVTFCFVVL